MMLPVNIIDENVLVEIVKVIPTHIIIDFYYVFNSRRSQRVQLLSESHCEFGLP